MLRRLDRIQSVWTTTSPRVFRSWNTKGERTTQGISPQHVRHGVGDQPDHQAVVVEIQLRAALRAVRQEGQQPPVEPDADPVERDLGAGDEVQDPEEEQGRTTPTPPQKTAVQIRKSFRAVADSERTAMWPSSSGSQAGAETSRACADPLILVPSPRVPPSPPGQPEPTQRNSRASRPGSSSAQSGTCRSFPDRAPGGRTSSERIPAAPSSLQKPN